VKDDCETLEHLNGVRKTLNLKYLALLD